jgi:hypothetical protein
MVSCKNIRDRLLSNSIKYRLLLVLLIILVFLNNFVWLQSYKKPPVGNELQDLFPGINFYLDIIHHKAPYSVSLHDLKSPVFLKFFWLDFLEYIRITFFQYPPLLPASYTLFYLFFGPSMGMELIVNVIYLAIALVSLYGIGKQLRDGKAGVFIAFIFSSFPGVICISRTVYAEFALMCLLTMCAIFLFKTDFFRNRRYSFALGISLGLTALTKWEFPLTLAVPFLIYFIQSHLVARDNGKAFLSFRSLWINFLISIVTAILIAFLWYSQSMQDIRDRLFVGSGRIDLAGSVPFRMSFATVEKFLYYPEVLINSFIGFFYFLLLIAVAISFVYKVIKNRHAVTGLRTAFFYILFFASWVIIPYFILSLVIRTPSHIMPILPVIAIAIGYGILSFKNTIIRSILVVLVLVYGIGSHMNSLFSFGEFRKLYRINLYTNQNNLRLHLGFPTSLPTSEWDGKYFFPDRLDWKYEEILSFIEKDSRPEELQPVILILPHFDFSSFEYYKLLYNHRVFIEPKGADKCPSPPDRSKFDYVVISLIRGTIFDSKFLSRDIGKLSNFLEVHKIDDFQKTFFEKYRLIKEFYLPDKFVAKIYKLRHE